MLLPKKNRLQSKQQALIIRLFSQNLGSSEHQLQREKSESEYLWMIKVMSY